MPSVDGKVKDKDVVMGDEGFDVVMANKSDEKLGLCSGGKIGVCYGRNADDLPTPDKAAQLVKLHSIKYVRIYDSNIQVIKAFANTGVELMIGVPNSDLLAFSQYQSNVDTWLKNSILPYYPATMITYITVGAEVTESRINVSSLVVPAMTNVHAALEKARLHKRIKVSSTHSLGVLSRSFPPSAGAFNSSYAFFLRPMLEFLVENESPFMVDLYPYYAYRDSPTNVSLSYALFSSSSSDIVDPNTGLVYTNMFDAQLDAVFFALMALNFRTLEVMVTESGWPNKGSAKETVATTDDAQTYNTNLIRHVINDTGTPAKPGEEIDVYIFSLFNENRKPGLESERHWGLFYPDRTSIYSLDLTGRGNVDVITGGNMTSSNRTWCVASSNASELDLQNALDWACGSGNVDCSAIQPSQPCYQPDTLVSHASYAFNSYYHQNGASDVACSFGGTGIRTTKDPSYDNCIYATSRFYNSLPPISKAYGTLCLLTTAACQLGILSPGSISLFYPFVLSHFQAYHDHLMKDIHKVYIVLSNLVEILATLVWRLLTNFFFLGKFSINFGIRLLMIARYGVQLERGPFDKRPADFLWMMMFGAFSLLVSFVCHPSFIFPFLRDFTGLYASICLEQRVSRCPDQHIWPCYAKGILSTMGNAFTGCYLWFTTYA
ncbi:putative Glucan endo-1,3-beta-glucosidase 13 [Cocos nucifera]|uniref:glucan endo-1,3-beta-D-glucosidase n=1 Tax=Cocos nucifera TaxID=13894 RepID=A0A8K0IA63_COCNU|nr:putative Glucan endo-1,3-beta-glucosidase 13 [Cocos nucifera]